MNVPQKIKIRRSVPASPIKYVALGGTLVVDEQSSYQRGTDQVY